MEMPADLPKDLHNLRRPAATSQSASLTAPLSGEPLGVRNFELLQITREKSRKTEGGFSGRFKEVRREIEIPPGSFSFGEAKENAGHQL